MVTTYSRRLLSPYTSMLQVAEIGDARAISSDGRNWQIQYRVAEQQQPGTSSSGKPSEQYTLLATIENGELRARPRFGFLDTEEVSTTLDELVALARDAALPFAALDSFEYWLLDETDKQPLALLRSCISAAEMATSDEELAAYRVRPEWLAMPAAQLKIEDSETTAGHYVPPVNHRLQQLIGERAGLYPKAEWFDRGLDQSLDFPSCLISETWDREQDHELCQRYIRRLAPRLLMLQGLCHGDRQRLEQAARENAIDVERFYSLYPEIVDEKLIKSLRVETKMRLAAESGLA